MALTDLSEGTQAFKTAADAPPMAFLLGLRQSSGAVAQWLGETINHAMGNPREEQEHQPPLVGVQPYCDSPRRGRRSRHALGRI